MKIIKILGFIVLGLIAIFLIVAAFLPSEYSVSRETTVNVSADSAYNQVVVFKDRNKWDPWLALDTEAIVTITNTEYSWKGEIIGEGKMKVLESEPNKSIHSKLTFLSPNQMTSDVYWNFESVDSTTTKLTWTYAGELGYPAERYFGLFLEDMMGPQFELGLSNLKTLLEK
ncbi:MAG: SRPBCC family protein [Melioribacteraceae bacterium]|nr:SRPBCC family protein [Melioribacteraceae bacterium]